MPPHLPCKMLQMQGVAVDPAILSHLLTTCVSAGAWDQALQLSNAALVAQVGGRAGGSSGTSELLPGRTFWLKPGELTS